MRRLVPARMLLTVSLSILTACAAAEKEADFKAVADRLTAGKTDRIGKIVALHSFVRDQIAQVQTSFS